MKKFVSMLLVSAMLITALTACDNNKTNDSDSNPSNSSTATGGGDSTSTDGESSVGDSSSDNESSTSEDSASTPEDSASTSEDSTPDPDASNSEDTSEPEGVDNSELPFPDNKAGNMAKAALAADNWPAMDIVDDPEYISVMISPDFNVDTLEEYCFSTNFISAQLNKVVVVKPKADNETEVAAALDAYFETVTTDPNIVFYPAQEESAKGAVKGKTDDGYYYVIVHEKGADIESAMLAAV